MKIDVARLGRNANWLTFGLFFGAAVVFLLA
jgi:hypothetical protein